MSDLIVPSYRVRPERSAVSGRMLAVAGGMLGVLALGGAIFWGLSRVGPRPVPLIEPDPRPIKVKPEEPGGLVVPNQNETIFDRPGPGQRREDAPATARLAPPPEAPALDLLRLQQQPPPPPVPAPAAPQAAAPAAPSAVAQDAAAPAAPAESAAPARGSAAPATQEPPAPASRAGAAPVTEPPPARTAPVAGGRAQIQLGALPSEAAARAEWERLVLRVPELAGRQPQITKLEREGKPTLWRLRTGGLADRAAANALCEQVRGKGAACVPVAP